MGEWVSIDVALPEDDSYVVAAKSYGFDILPDMYVAWFYNGRFHVCDDALEAENHDGLACITSKVVPTHWMKIGKIVC